MSCNAMYSNEATQTRRQRWQVSKEPTWWKFCQRLDVCNSWVHLMSWRCSPRPAVCHLCHLLRTEVHERSSTFQILHCTLICKPYKAMTITMTLMTTTHSSTTMVITYINVVIITVRFSNGKCSHLIVKPEIISNISSQATIQADKCQCQTDMLIFETIDKKWHIWWLIPISDTMDQTASTLSTVYA